MKRFICIKSIRTNGFNPFKEGHVYMSIPKDDGTQQFIDAEPEALPPGKIFVSVNKELTNKFFKELLT